MGKMAAAENKRSSRRSSPRKERGRVPFVDDGPPREVIIKVTMPQEIDADADALLDELLDDQTSVSSLAHTAEDHKHKHDLGKVISDADSNEDRTWTESVGVAAARARYKAHSAPSDKPSAKTNMIHFDKREMADPTRGNMEELSLGENAHVTNSNQPIEVIDVESIKKTAKRTPTDDTSKTFSGTESPSLYKMKPRVIKQESGVDTEEDDDVSDDEHTAGTKSLLARVHDRLTISKLKEEIEKLHDVIDTKNAELEVLAGQLRRAVETKCDLVLAHKELELHHENNLKVKENEANQLMKANFGLMEGLADVEKELTNEIVRLQLEASEASKQHVQELQDWERMHKNEMLERDCEIARLREEVRKLLLKTSSSSNSGGITGELVAC